MSTKTPLGRVLIVEDEPSIARGLKFNFEQDGYEATVATDGPTALTHFEPGRTRPDCVILDLMLPGMSGYDICETVRRRDSHVPILVLSARTLAEDKARAFDVGCDQYVPKPFALEELLSRVRNLISRRGKTPPVSTPDDDPILLGESRIDFRTHRLTRDGEEFELTKMEVALLRYLLDHEGEVLSRSQITRDVWEQDAAVSTRSIDNFVLRLRKLIEPNPSRPQHLLSVRGTGYRLLRRPA